MVANVISAGARVRTFLALGTSLATVIAALLLHPFGRAPTVSAGDDGMLLAARLTSTQILRNQSSQDMVVTITAPEGAVHARPPLSLAIVIDRSGSMNGEPMQNAKAAAARLVSQLDASDAFTIVTYSSSDETVFPMSRATDANKSRAMSAIGSIYDDGGTCISCGLVRGANELNRSPVHGGVQRIVLISDGQANEGVYDRDELAKLAADTAAKGASISTVGVGLDFDEVTMVRLADVGRGNYYFVEDTRHLDAMFAKELGGLAETVAADVRMMLFEQPGVRIEEAYGYPMSRTGGYVMVPVADLRAGEQRKVVLRVSVDAGSASALDIAKVTLGWRRVADGTSRRATTELRVDVTDDAKAVAESVDVRAVEAVEQVNTARALEEASAAYDRDGAEAANQIMQRRMDAVRANKALPPAAMQKLESVNMDAQAGFAAAPSGGAGGAKAKKASRAKAYELVK
jgi:Ca-activated chloride channel family protein